MKKLLTVTFLSGMLTLLRMGCGFVISKIIAVYTGPTGLALLGQLQSFASICNGIINASVSSGIVRYTSEHADDPEEKYTLWWKGGIQVGLIIYTCLCPAIILLSPLLSKIVFDSDQYSVYIILIGLLLPFSMLGTIFNSILNGLQQYKRFVFTGMISVITSFALMCLLTIRFGVKGALMAASLQAAILGITLGISCVKFSWFRFKNFWGKVDKKQRADINKYLSMAMISALTLPVAQVCIRKILIAEVGWDMAGQWQSVWKISEVYLSVVTMALGTYFMPKLAKLKDAEEIHKEIRSVVLIILPIIIVMALCIYMTRDFIIQILFTSEFSKARDLFMIQLVGDVLKIWSWIYAYPMLSRAAVKWYISTEVAFAFIWVLMSFLLIDSIGTQGANLAYMFAYSFYLIFMIFNLKKFAK
ncbi:O-antigen translocase [Trabulsiella odontotermitis]|uniref:O-antigen translocase n=1 Tax=Trabulsiella odontotermitis TaxID=379893 RepID=UPI003AC94855